MTPDSMAADARCAIAAGTRMTMTLLRGSQRLLPGFPRGELLCESHDGRNVYSYDPARVLAWLGKHGLLSEDASAPANAN